MESDKIEVQRTTRGDVTMVEALWWHHNGGVGCREREEKCRESMEKKRKRGLRILSPNETIWPWFK